MKAEDLQKKMGFENMEEVLAYLLECKVSLNTIRFDTLNMNLNNKRVETLIEESKDIYFSREVLFLITNRTNIPVDMENIKPVQVLKMALLSNMKKPFIYNSEKYIKDIKEAVVSSNNVIKTQYLPLLTGIGSNKELENNAKAIYLMINEMKTYNLPAAIEIKEYIDKICLENIIINDRTIARKNAWLNITSEVTNRPNLKM